MTTILSKAPHLYTGEASIFRSSQASTEDTEACKTDKIRTHLKYRNSCNPNIIKRYKSPINVLATVSTRRVISIPTRRHTRNVRATIVAVAIIKVVLVKLTQLTF